MALRAVPVSEYKPKKRLKAVPVADYKPPKKDEEPEETSPAVDFARGLGQAVLAEHGDEAEAGVRTALDYLKGDVERKDLLDRYYKTKGKINKEIEKASESYLSPYYAGQAAGVFSPGGLGARIAKSGYKGAMALGGLAGLGSSEAELLKGKDYGKAARDVGIGAGLGAAGEKVGRVVGARLRGRTVPELRKLAEDRREGSLHKKVGKYIGDLDPETVDQFLKNPDKFKQNIKRKYSDISQDASDAYLPKIDALITKSAEKSYELLDKTPKPIKSTDLAEAYDKAIKDIRRKTKNVVMPGSEDGRAIKYLERERKKLLDLGPHIPAEVVKKRLQQLDQLNKKAYTSTDRPDLLLRTRLNERGAIDDVLKDVVPGYRKHMETVAQPLQQKRKFVEKRFKSEPTAQTFLKRLSTREHTVPTEELKTLKEVEKATGLDLADAFKSSYLYHRTGGESTKSSRDVNKWALVGGGLAAALGTSGADSQAIQLVAAGMGALLGDAVAKYGKRTVFDGIVKAKAISDRLRKLPPLMRREKIKDLQKQAERSGGGYLVALELIRAANKSNEGKNG